MAIEIHHDQWRNVFLSPIEVCSVTVTQIAHRWLKFSSFYLKETRFARTEQLCLARRVRRISSLLWVFPIGLRPTGTYFAQLTN